MEKVKSKSFFWVWSFIGLFVSILIWNLPWRFQVNDDEIMMWLVSGAYTSTPESYAVFIHPILSWSLSQLYSIAPNIKWYPATWFIVNYTSFLVLLYVLETQFWTRSQKLLLSLLLISLLIHFDYFPQFTLVAGFATIAAIALSFSAKSSFGLLISLSLFLIALLIRYESVLLCLFISFTIYFILNPWDKSLVASRNLWFLIISIIIIVSKGVWERNSEYEDFLKFSKARSGVIDHPVFYQKLTNQKIQEGDEWFFFSRWFFEDGEITIEKLKAEKRTLDKQFFTFNQLANTSKRILDIQKKEAFKSFVSLIILMIFISINSRKKWWALLSLGLLFFILNHFFLLYGRVTLLFFLCLLVPIFNSSIQIAKRVVMNGLNALLLLGIAFHTWNFLTEAQGRRIMEKELNFLTSSVPVNEPIILEGYQEHMFLEKYSRNSPTPFLSMGWISRSPFQKQALKRFGFEDFNDIKSYSLLSIQMDESVVFPDYIESINGDFHLSEKAESDNFVLWRFLKE